MLFHLKISRQQADMLSDDDNRIQRKKIIVATSSAKAEDTGTRVGCCTTACECKAWPEHAQCNRLGLYIVN